MCNEVERQPAPIGIPFCLVRCRAAAVTGAAGKKLFSADGSLAVTET